MNQNDIWNEAIEAAARKADGYAHITGLILSQCRIDEKDQAAAARLRQTAYLAVAAEIRWLSRPAAESEADVRYFLDRDGTGSWYLVRDDKQAEWFAWLQIPDDDQRGWEPPEFAKRIGGFLPAVTFSAPEIEGN